MIHRKKNALQIIILLISGCINGFWIGFVIFSSVASLCSHVSFLVVSIQQSQCRECPELRQEETWRKLRELQAAHGWGDFQQAQVFMGCRNALTPCFLATASGRSIN